MEKENYLFPATKKAVEFDGILELDLHDEINALDDRLTQIIKDSKPLDLSKKREVKSL